VPDLSGAQQVLGALEQPADAPTLLRRLRAGELHTRVHPAQPVITVGESDEVATLRAYEAGSDHHLESDTSYLVLRAVVAALARRTLQEVTSRHVHVGELHIDTAARTADVDGTPVKLTRTGFTLLTTLAADPQRVFTKDELARVLWGAAPATSSRALESHICHLRRNLADAGADLIVNAWGQGYKLASADDR